MDLPAESQIPIVVLISIFAFLLVLLLSGYSSRKTNATGRKHEFKSVNKPRVAFKDNDVDPNLVDPQTPTLTSSASGKPETNQLDTRGESSSVNKLNDAVKKNSVDGHLPISQTPKKRTSAKTNSQQTPTLRSRTKGGLIDTPGGRRSTRLAKQSKSD